jgi:PKHD-type hydroxylase
MIVTIADILSGADLEEVRNGLSAVAFIDGRETAGWAAKGVKANLQARTGRQVARLRDLIAARLLAHPVFALAARPKQILGPLFARYEPGHAYGVHVDDALIGGVRADMSFTVFLSPPEGYQGGELIIDTAAGEEAFKLAAGSMVLYPATTLHRVAPVQHGERLAAAGWVRSLIRDPTRRELLFDLDTARRRLFAAHGKTEEGDLLAKCAVNLMRLWCED